MHAQLRINEVMQSNVDCLMDDLNQFPDSWVELYNPTNEMENMEAYKIGLTDNPDEAWQLTSQAVYGKNYILVYCDKEATNHHTDFRLDSDEGGSVYLFKDGVVVDKFTDIPEQPAPNISYGRKDEESSELGFQLTPTPSKQNCGTICNQILGKVIFDKPGLVSPSTSRITLHLSMPEGTPENAVIRYTTDGTEPTESSNQYNGNALTIKCNSVVRAKIFCEGYLSKRSTCHSYISHGRDVTLPVISMVTDNTYFYDNKIGIYVGGSYNPDQENYKYDWRRPVNLEYFVPGEDESVINQLGETRISGAASRSCQVKSLTFYANKRFGKKRLKYEFFPTQRPGLDKFKSILFRNSGNDFDYLYFRDAAIQRSFAEHVDLDWQAWQPAIFYFNGTYMGMLNVRERSTEDNIWANYDGLEDIDMVENYGELKAGDWTAFNEFKDFYQSTDHTYAEYDERMDINEYQNLMLMNLFYCNLDFPGNNIVQWRPREEGSKWRWVAKDTDFGLGLYGRSASYNTIAWFYDNNYDSGNAWANTSDATRLFRRLMEIEQFRWEFLDKVAIYTGTFLSATKVNALLDEMANEISFEYPHHRELINPWWPNYSNELSNAKSWMSSRLTYFLKYLVSKYGLSSTLNGRINDQVSKDDKEVISVEVNGIPIEEAYMNGKLFNGRELKFKSSCSDTSREIKGWTVLQVGTDGHSSTTTIEGSDFTFTPTNLSLVSFNAILGESTGIDEVATTDKDILYIYDTAGRRIPELRKGINIVKYTDGTTRKIDLR